MNSVLSLTATLHAQIGRLSVAVDLDTRGQTLVLVGPNGAGKTTVLSLLLGVMPPQRGRLSVGAELLLDTAAHVNVPVEQRRLAYVPQDYALFPHLSVRDNVAFAVHSAADKQGMNKAHAGKTPAEKAHLIEQRLQDLGVAHLAKRSPNTLSGGEKQRVALARALSVAPRALLLDEPLAALDIASRREVRRFLAEKLRALTIPSIVVTHDPADARALAGSIVVLESGQVTQAGSWDELVRAPASRFVEEFVAPPQL